MLTQQFGMRGLVALLLAVLGLSIPAVANATISLDTTTYGTASATGGGSASIAFSGTSGDTVFFAEDYELGPGIADIPSAPTIGGTAMTFLGYGGSAGGWFPVNLAVWYASISSNGGTITYYIPSAESEQNDVAVIVDAFSGVTSVDSEASHWGKQDPGNAYCDITPGYSSSLVVGYTAYGNIGYYLPTAGSGLTETSEIGFNFTGDDCDELLGEYSTGNASGTGVDVDSADDGYDEGYDEVVAACH